MEDGLLEAYNHLLLRHYATEFLVKALLNIAYSSTQLEELSGKMRGFAEERRAANRAGAAVKRSSLFGMDAPLLDMVSALLAEAADQGRSDGGDDLASPAGGDSPQAAPSTVPDAPPLDDGAGVVVSLFAKHGPQAATS